MTGPDLSTGRLTRPLLLAGIIGGLALASGVALTVTSGWLIVKASEMPVILTLMTAIVGVRAFGMARPAFRYWERLGTHDAALADLARSRSPPPALGSGAEPTSSPVSSTISTTLSAPRSGSPCPPFRHWLPGTSPRRSQPHSTRASGSS